MKPNPGSEALGRYRAEMKALTPEQVVFDDLYDLTLQQVWKALTQSATKAPIRQRYHLAILRMGDKNATPAEKGKAYGDLKSLTRGTGTEG